MKMSFRRAGVITAGTVLIAGGVLIADGTRFSDFTPLTASAGPTVNEAMPITFGNPDFQQLSIADRTVADAAVASQLRELGHDHRQ